MAYEHSIKVTLGSLKFEEITSEKILLGICTENLAISFREFEKAGFPNFWLLVYFLYSTTTVSQNLDQKLNCLEELLILGEATEARSFP